jgi:hypothetical protein
VNKLGPFGIFGWLKNEEEDPLFLNGFFGWLVFLILHALFPFSRGKTVKNSS